MDLPTAIATSAAREPSQRRPIYRRHGAVGIGYPTVQDALLAAVEDYDRNASRYGEGSCDHLDLRMLLADARGILASIAARAVPDEDMPAEPAARAAA